MRRLLCFAALAGAAFAVAVVGESTLRFDDLTTMPLEQVIVPDLNTGAPVQLVSNDQYTAWGGTLEAPSGEYAVAESTFIIRSSTANGIDLKSLYVAPFEPTFLYGNVPQATSVKVVWFDANDVELDSQTFPLTLGYKQLKVKMKRAAYVVVFGNGDGSAPLLIDNVKLHQH